MEFQLYRKKELIYTGTLSDIAKKINISRSAATRAHTRGELLFGEFIIKKVGVEVELTKPKPKPQKLTYYDKVKRRLFECGNTIVCGKDAQKIIDGLQKRALNSVRVM